MKRTSAFSGQASFAWPMLAAPTTTDQQTLFAAPTPQKAQAAQQMTDEQLAKLRRRHGAAMSRAVEKARTSARGK